MDLVQPTPAREIDMLVHDCMQYAKRLEMGGDAAKAPHAALIDVGWEPAEDPLMQVVRLRKLKDVLIRLNGQESFPWAL